MAFPDETKKELGQWLQSQANSRGYQLFEAYLKEQVDSRIRAVITKRGDACDFEKGEIAAFQWILDARDRLNKIIEITGESSQEK